MKTMKRLKTILSSEKGKSIIRHSLSAIGGLLVGYGFIDESVLEGLIGSIMTILGIFLSFKHNEGVK